MNFWKTYIQSGHNPSGNHSNLIRVYTCSKQIKYKTVIDGAKREEKQRKKELEEQYPKEGWYWLNQKKNKVSEKAQLTSWGLPPFQTTFWELLLGLNDIFK